MPDYQLIELSSDPFDARSLAGADSVGLDTEFMRERTFFAELCLVQLALPGSIVCIDPLGDVDNAVADCFWDALCDVEWVVHSARQDIEVISQASGRMPRAIFDTQVAAALLGFQPQIGYAGLVKTLFDVELDKSHTRANWSKRPLSGALLQYAAEDVRFLLPAREELTDRLEAKGRLQWAIEDSRDLLDESLYAVDPELAVQRLKGARNLRGRPRAAAAALARWREEEALQRNLPRQWIMRDPVLLEIATQAPDSVDALHEIDGLAEKTIRRAGRKLVGIVKDATEDRSGHQPPQRPDERQKQALKRMQMAVAARADEIDLAAELLAPKKELSAAMLGERDLRVFRGWRRELVGDALLELLED